MTRLLLSRVCVAFLFVAGLCFSASDQMSRANTFTWTGANNANWTAGTSWIGGATPPNDDTADIAFTGSGGAASQLNQTWVVKSLYFDSGVAYSVNSNSLYIGGGGISTTDNAAGGVAVSSIINLYESQTWYADSASTLNVSGSIFLNNDTLATNGGGAINLSGTIARGGNIVLNGTGTVTMSGSSANTYTGTVYVNAGSLTLSKSVTNATIAGDLVIGDPAFNDGIDQRNSFASVGLGASNQIGDSSTVTVNRHGTLNIGLFQEYIPTLILNGGAVSTGTGTNQFLGFIFNSGNLTTTANSNTASVSGVLYLNDDANHSTEFNIAAGNTASGIDLEVDALVYGGAITKDGAGCLYLTNANTFAGGVTQNSGKLLVGSNTALGTGTLTMADQTILEAAFPTQLANAVSIPTAGTNGIIDGPNNLTLTGTLNFPSGGGLIKNGAGTLTLNNSTTRSMGGGLAVNNGTMAIATGGTGGLTIGGSLAIGATSGQTATLSVNGGSLIQNNATNVVVGAAGNGIATLSVGTTSNGALATGSGGLVINPTGVVTFGSGVSTGTLTANGPVTINGGTLSLNAGMFSTPAFSAAPLRLQDGGTLNTSMPIGVPIFGDVSTAINVGANISLGSTTVFNGFSHQGVLTVNGHTLSLASFGYAQLGVLTTLNTGTINAPNGVTLATGSVLQGGGSINGRFTGPAGSVISCSLACTMQLGDATSFAGFNFGGEIQDPLGALTLNSAGTATLGNLTTVSGGTDASRFLSAPNGFVLNFGDAITGFGFVNSANSSAHPSIVNGILAGTSPTQELMLNGWIEGVLSPQSTNVMFTGSHQPGPGAAAISVGNIGYASTAKLILALGGTSRGDQYDAIEASGALTLGGTLVVTLNNFMPAAGNSFDILDWGSLNGTFSSVQLPALAGGLTWNTSQLYTTGTISVVGLVGDYNRNGTVDAADYTIWRDTLGSTTDLRADGNDNGVIDQADFGVWKAHFGEHAGSGAGSAATSTVPEPATWVLLLMAGAMMYVGQRSRP
jgi:autotransporter-associated beta strand protein